MKNSRFIYNAVAVLLVGILFVAYGCKKEIDDQGNRITYYKNKTGEGYFFFKYNNDSIGAMKNAKIGIESWASDGWTGIFAGRITHFDYVYTDANGKYSFKFVKKIDGAKATYFRVFVEYFDNMPNPYSVSGNYITLNYSLLDNSNTVFIDTIFYHPDMR